MRNLLQDVRYGFRSCGRIRVHFNRIAALALGIGANTVIFSVVNACCCARSRSRSRSS